MDGRTGGRMGPVGRHVQEKDCQIYCTTTRPYEKGDEKEVEEKEEGVVKPPLWSPIYMAVGGMHCQWTAKILFSDTLAKYKI